MAQRDALALTRNPEVSVIGEYTPRLPPPPNPPKWKSSKQQQGSGSLGKNTASIIGKQEEYLESTGAGVFYCGHHWGAARAKEYVHGKFVILLMLNDRQVLLKW